MNSKKWHRLAKIFGQDGEQQQVKIETNYIRVHPCCHQLIQKNSNYRQLSMPELNNSTLIKNLSTFQIPTFAGNLRQNLKP